MSVIINNLWSDLQEWKRLPPDALNKLLDDAAGLTLERWRQIKPTTPEERINFYALYAFELSEGVKRHLQDGRKLWLHDLVTLAGEENWQKVLDFGCGIGSDGLVLAEAGLEVHFLDVLNSAFNFARWRAVKYGFKKTKFFLLQPVSQHYDCIICVDVLGHTANPRKAIIELMRWTHNLWLLDNIHEGHEDYHEGVQVIHGPLASQHFNQIRPHLWRRDETAFDRV